MWCVCVCLMCNFQDIYYTLDWGDSHHILQFWSNTFGPQVVVTAWWLANL